MGVYAYPERVYRDQNGGALGSRPNLYKRHRRLRTGAGGKSVGRFVARARLSGTTLSSSENRNGVTETSTERNRSQELGGNAMKSSAGVCSSAKTCDDVWGCHLARSIWNSRGQDDVHEKVSHRAERMSENLARSLQSNPHGST